jgi:hypothetical protein
MKKYFLIPLLLSNIILISCKKYLDVKSDTKLVVPGTLNDFQNLLDNAADMNYATPSYGCSSTDDFFLTDASYNTKSVFFQNVYRWNPYPYRYQNDWASCYKVVYNSNLCLERLALVPRDASNAAYWDHIKGSALFYKAYHNLELVWLFAKAYDAGTAATDLGIPLRVSTDFMIPSHRASVKESYEYILAEAKVAAALLPTTQLVVTRPTKVAAYGLLARTYLSMQQFDSAYKYADLALQLKNDLMNYNDATLVAVNGANPFKIFNKEVVFHATTNVLITLYHPSTGPARIDTALYAGYHANDLRKKAFFAVAAPYQRFKGSYSGNINRLFSGIATDELLLIRAECNARAGDNLNALTDLNRLLQHRFPPAAFVPVATSTSAESLDIILKERRKELIFRGSLRWSDIKRLNKEGSNIELKRKIASELIILPANDSRYALPIPQDIIETSGIQQN